MSRWRSVLKLFLVMALAAFSKHGSWPMQNIVWILAFGLGYYWFVMEKS